MEDGALRYILARTPSYAMRFRLPVIALLLTLLSACVHIGSGDPPNYVVWRSGLASSAQPNAGYLARAKDLGYAAVINLAPPDSMGSIAEEGTIVRAQGLTYVNIPVDFDRPTLDDYQRFSAAMKPLAGKSVLGEPAGLVVHIPVSRHRRGRAGCGECIPADRRVGAQCPVERVHCGHAAALRQVGGDPVAEDVYPARSKAAARPARGHSVMDRKISTCAGAAMRPSASRRCRYAARCGALRCSAYAASFAYIS